MLFERVIIKGHVSGTRSWKMALNRAIILVVIVLVAMLIPYFIPLMSIGNLHIHHKEKQNNFFPSFNNKKTKKNKKNKVSDISVVAVIYILPPILYWKMKNDVLTGWKGLLMKIGCVFIVLYGLTGSAFGLKVAIPELINAVRKGGDPFEGFFTFACSPPPMLTPLPPLFNHTNITAF